MSTRLLETCRNQLHTIITYTRLILSLRSYHAKCQCLIYIVLYAQQRMLTRIEQTAFCSIQKDLDLLQYQKYRGSCNLQSGK